MGNKGRQYGWKKQPRPSGLDPCYLGPYQVASRRGVDLETQVEKRQILVNLNRCKTFKRSGRLLGDNDTSERNNPAHLLLHRPTPLSLLNESSESNYNTCPHQSDGEYNSDEEPISPVPIMIVGVHKVRGANFGDTETTSRHITSGKWCHEPLS